VNHAILALGVIAACTHGEAAVHDEQPPDDEIWLSGAQMEKAGIRVAAAAQRSLPQTTVVGGRIAFDDLHVSHVFSPVTGRVTRVLAKPGERVKKGAPLVAILSPDVGSAFSDLVKAQADLQASEADFRREQRLVAEDATSKRSFEAAQDAFRRATAEHDRAQQRASLLRTGGVNTVTQEYVLHAPIEGDVITRNVSPGGEVAGQYSGGNAQELFTVGDIKSVWAYADVPDTDLPKMRVGQAVEVRVVAYPSQVFKGAIDLISSTVDPVLRTARVRCALGNAGEELKPEMFATVSVLQPAQQGIAVPRDAVVAINESTYVFVQTGKRPDGRITFKRRSVTAGEERDGAVPILDGIQPGEQVVINGSISGDQPNDEVWPTPAQIAAAHITTAKVERKDVADAVAIGARMTFDDTQIAHVFSPVNGRISKVVAQPGQHVGKGAPLAMITSPDLGAYMADVAKADADRIAAGHEVQRQQDLFDAGVGAKRDLEAAQDTQRRAQAEYDRAKQLTDLLRSSDYDAVSQEYVLRSPIDGDVIARHANPGLEIQGQYANGGSSSNVIELFTVGELGQLWVLGEVYELDLPRVREGDEVTIRPSAYPDQVFHGRVEWVADVLDPVQHTARVRCVIDNHARLLKPEMYERVEIRVPANQVLVVPRNALMRVDGETIAFVETGEKKPDGGVVFERRKVTARLDSNAALIPVSSGLGADETVAVDHSLMLLGML
jgi:cobalt-zinc-cadmium efflux system membrane fusion protein